MISAAIRGTPWLLQGMLAALVVAAVLRRRLADRLGSPPLVAFALLACLGVILVVTLTPSPDGGFWGRGRVASFALTWEVFRHLGSVNHLSLNVLLLVPLALLAQFVGRREIRRVVTGGVFALPVAVELVQYLLPVLGRSGFQMDDVVANTTGVLLGATLGLVARRLLARTPYGRRALTGP